MTNIRYGLVLSENGALLQWASLISKFAWNRAKRCLGTYIWSCQENKSSYCTVFVKHIHSKCHPISKVGMELGETISSEEEARWTGWLANVVNLVREGGRKNDPPSEIHYSTSEIWFTSERKTNHTFYGKSIVMARKGESKTDQHKIHFNDFKSIFPFVTEMHLKDWI